MGATRKRIKKFLLAVLSLSVVASPQARAQQRTRLIVGASAFGSDTARLARAAHVNVSVSSDHQTVWPWFALGGGILAGGVTWATVLRKCDQGCQDDGGRQRGFTFTIGAAAVGAVVGALLGSLVDDSRAHVP